MLEFINTKSIQQKEFKVIEKILFRSSDGDTFHGYLQTTDSRPLTVYCEATTVYPDLSYEIKILHETTEADVQIVGRSVTFTPPLDFVVQCRANVSIASENNYLNALLIVKGQPPVRLTAGQQPNEGILQVLWNNSWSTVSQEGFASTSLKQNGAVLCRMLGFSGFFKSKSSDIISMKENDFSNYPVKFECSGKENNIHNCKKTNLKTNTNTNNIFQPARITCQSGCMLAPNQNAVQVSKKTDIQVELQVLPFNRSIYVRENVTVSCLLQFQLPRFHVAQFFALKNGLKDKLHSKITRATMKNQNIQLILEHNFTASLENSNTTFICQGMDSISQVYKETSQTLTFKQGLTIVDVIPEPQACTYSFQCAVNEEEAVQRSWNIHHLNKKVESNVSQSFHLTLSCKQLNLIEKICCSVNRKVLTATFASEKCFDMRLHAISKFNQTFTNLGFSGRNGTVQQFKVPMTGCYEIIAKGASGGDRHSYVGGKGANVVTNVILVRNDVYTVVVGQKGESTILNGLGGGGGGASIVYKNTNLLIIAGGGGGGSFELNGNSGKLNRGLNSRNCLRNKFIGGYGAGWQMHDFLASNAAISPAGSLSNNWLGGAGLAPNNASAGGFGGGGAGVSATDSWSLGGGGGGFVGGEALYCGSKAARFTDGGSSYCAPGNSCIITEGGNPQRDGEVVFRYQTSVC